VKNTGAITLTEDTSSVS